MNEKNKAIVVLLIGIGVAVGLILTRLDSEYTIIMFLAGIFSGSAVAKLKE